VINEDRVCGIWSRFHVLHTPRFGLQPIASGSGSKWVTQTETQVKQTRETALGLRLKNRTILLSLPVWSSNFF
jgi:hypothetical protein